jgi:hypothetical protein
MKYKFKKKKIWMNRVEKNIFFILNVMRWEKIYFFKGKKKNINLFIIYNISQKLLIIYV